MRFGVALVMALSLGACGQAEQPGVEAPAVAEAPAAEPVELGQTQSTIDCPLEKATYGEPQAGWWTFARYGPSGRPRGWNSRLSSRLRRKRSAMMLSAAGL